MWLPESSRKNIIVFWIIISIFTIIFGLTILGFNLIEPGAANYDTHPIARLFQLRFEHYVILIIVGGFAGYVTFGAIGLLSMAVYFLLTRFDDNLRKNGFNNRSIKVFLMTAFSIIITETILLIFFALSTKG